LTPIAWIETHPRQFQAWLVEKRWFGDKSRTIESLTVTDFVTVAIDGLAVSHLQVSIQFDDGGNATYLVPLIANQEGSPQDAFESSAYLDWLGAGFDEERVVALRGDENGRLEWRPGARTGSDSWLGLPAKVLTGEQSNTSILYGDRSIVKVFRKVQAGINPDSEIISFLSGQVAFPYVPRFEGAVVVVERGEGMPAIELATAQAFVPNEGDCWRWLPGALAASSDDDRTKLLDSIGLLGQRTGELHVALEQGTGDAFGPESFTEQDVADLEARISREVQLTASMLFRQGALSHGESEDLAAGLLAGVMQADSLLGSSRTRVHGDYHLGQVLRAGDDFVIIDFEGEPSRTMEERREKHSPLKDVAGMLRSIDYAVASASVDADPERLPALRGWGVESADRFKAEYLAAIRAGGGRFLPADDASFARSLDLFIIDKALYEVRYELDNRPDWLHIPLGSLQDIARAS
jgi:trehalose synthase-fused probable maltokinase